MTTEKVSEKIGSKLHQALAVDGELRGNYDKMLAEALKTFKERSAHYQGHSKTYQSLKENDENVQANDIKEPVDTVPSKLKYIQSAIIKHLDCLYQKELANTEAKADLIVELEDGTETILEKDVPATVLLNLETKLKEIRSVFEAAPTYDPEKQWFKLEGAADVYVTKAIETYSTKKVEEPLLLIAPTKEHPGQAKTITVDKNVGKWSTIHKSGALSPLDKSKLLARIDILIQATKRARQRSNDQNIVPVKIGQKLLNFINGI